MRRDRQRGGTLVEAALVILLLFTFIMAVIEFGRAYAFYHTLTNAAREGARFSVSPCALGGTGACTAQVDGGTQSFAQGALPGADAVRKRVMDFLRAGSVKIDPADAAQLTVDQAYETTQVNGVNLQYSRVRVSAPHRFLMFRYQINISSEAVMRNETN